MSTIDIGECEKTGLTLVVHRDDRGWCVAVTCDDDCGVYDRVSGYVPTLGEAEDLLFAMKDLGIEAVR